MLVQAVSDSIMPLLGRKEVAPLLYTSFLVCLRKEVCDELADRLLAAVSSEFTLILPPRQDILLSSPMKELQKAKGTSDIPRSRVQKQLRRGAAVNARSRCFTTSKHRTWTQQRR